MNHNIVFSKEQVEQMNQFYQQGENLEQIGKRFNRSKQVILKFLKRYGFQTRSNGGKVGEKANNWKGGKSWRRGYMSIKMPEHPRADIHGYVLEHILVWEKAHGKSLPKDHIIHHLNGIKHDNRIENLLAVTKSQHHSLREPYQKRIRELEEQIKKLRQPVLPFNFNTPTYVVMDRDDKEWVGRLYGRAN